ncbi:hypothetical protein Tsubulata_042035 [Turnera subulata]|uniref:Uncharacterized protein n=1 Tax=Turnera subulata TaxID=218843 RepID=A0A9Q0JIN2_9ROSI|nr:hypothetical protein Tsubulata_042035 [Turnera subulata]
MTMGPASAPFPIPKPKPSPSSSSSLILFFFFFFFFSFPAAAVPSSIYDLLRQHGLPIGIFPKGIADFSADPITGRFKFNLTTPCNADFENQLHYDFNVTGVLSPGQIANLTGVSQQELFLWFPVHRIHVDDPASGLIHFDVGVVHKQFSLALFENPPDCSAPELPPQPLLLFPSNNNKGPIGNGGVQVGQVDILKRRAAS